MARFGEIGVEWPPSSVSGQINRTPSGLGSAAWRSHSISLRSLTRTRNTALLAHTSQNMFLSCEVLISVHMAKS